MKVEQKKEFSPITITLETEEEAICLWHRLNTASTGILENGNVPVQHKAIITKPELYLMMFNTFNVCYKPEGV